MTVICNTHSEDLIKLEENGYMDGRRPLLSKEENHYYKDIGHGLYVFTNRDKNGLVKSLRDVMELLDLENWEVVVHCKEKKN